MQQSTGRFLGATLDSNPPNATVTPDVLHTDTSQQWLMVYIKFNTFVFQHVMTGRILDATFLDNGFGQAFGALPSLATYDGNISQQLWKVKKIGFAPLLKKGYYRIISKGVD